MKNNAIEPSRPDEGSNGFDLYSTVTVTLKPGETAMVSTGIAIELPKGSFAFVTPRSGLAMRHSISIMNTPGLIDQSYRNSIGVLLHNFGSSPYTVEEGDRIAQIVPMYQPKNLVLEEVNELSDSDRGLKGFGSSGK